MHDICITIAVYAVEQSNKHQRTLGIRCNQQTGWRLRLHAVHTTLVSRHSLTTASDEQVTSTDPRGNAHGYVNYACIGKHGDR